MTEVDLSRRKFLTHGHDRHRARWARRSPRCRSSSPGCPPSAPARRAPHRTRPLQARGRADGHDRVAHAHRSTSCAARREMVARIAGHDAQPEATSNSTVRSSPPTPKNDRRAAQRRGPGARSAPARTWAACPSSASAAGGAVPELAGRLLLPLPRLALRSRRRRVFEARRPRSTCACRRYSYPKPTHARGRRRREGSASMAADDLRQRRMPARRGGQEGLRGWFNKRLPVDEFIDEQLTGYYAPKNFNFWYYFGVARAGGAGAAARHRHLPHHDLQGGRGARRSTRSRYIMREVRLRVAASATCTPPARRRSSSCVYLHMFRALLYGSYTQAARAAVAVRHG